MPSCDVSQLCLRAISRLLRIRLATAGYVLASSQLVVLDPETISLLAIDKFLDP